MRRPRLRLALLGAFFPASLGAQLPEIKYETDRVLDLGRTQVTRLSQVMIDRTGRLFVATGQWDGVVAGFDSTGKSLGWEVPVGRRNNREIGWIDRWGFMGDSVWIDDRMYGQLVVLSDRGEIRRSIERPSWLRPAWGDRKQYPLFSGGEWLASYPDGTVLVRPGRRRAIFDAPQYDRSATHLFRATEEGKILRTVAKLPLSAGEGPGNFQQQLQLRDATLRKGFGIPFFTKTHFTVARDGQRIVVVEPLTGRADSGAVRVTMMNANGDTLFVKRYASEATRITPDQVEARLAGITEFGKYSAEWIKDTLRKQTPAFESRLINVHVGLDYSTWIWFRQPGAARGLVLDPNGEAVGWVAFAPTMRITALSLDRVWVVDKDPGSRFRDGMMLVRLKRTPTASRPARSASASASRTR